jgi:hypothetical protein
MTSSGAGGADSSSSINLMEMPQSIITRLIKEGQSAGNENIILTKDFKKAFQQLSGFFSLYLYSM